ncbi:MAG TPA: hypothetical protein VL614_27240 [Acetobacteraceae bacterium]|nr:hypothetical protein [Acetobacteraceae bacterium]
MWPAQWNGYPLVFFDAGTCLSQVIEHSAGWHRPVFDSVFLLAPHLTISSWPVIAVQALLIVYTLHLAFVTYGATPVMTALGPGIVPHA